MVRDLLPVLSTCRLFKQVSQERLGQLLESAGARIENHHAGKTVRHQGDIYDSLIIVASGRLEARIDDSTGRGMTVEHFKAPAAVGTAVLISSEPRLPVTLLASEEATLITIDTNSVLELFVREPEILKAYLADAGDKVRFLAEKIRLLRFGTLRQRIAGHLIGLSNDQKTENLTWRYSREQMADLLGVARPSLSRELSLMIQDGLVKNLDRINVRISSSDLKRVLEEA